MILLVNRASLRIVFSFIYFLLQRFIDAFSVHKLDYPVAYLLRNCGLLVVRSIICLVIFVMIMIRIA